MTVWAVRDDGVGDWGWREWGVGRADGALRAPTCALLKGMAKVTCHASRFTHHVSLVTLHVSPRLGATQKPLDPVGPRGG